MGFDTAFGNERFGELDEWHMTEECAHSVELRPGDFGKSADGKGESMRCDVQIRRGAEDRM
jgi:hypothetical protein